MFLFTPIQIEQLKATHDYLKTDGKPIHFIEADGKPIHCIAADRVAYFRQLVDAVHEILKYYNFPNNPKMSGFYAALLETNNNNVDLALHCMCVFLVVDQLINDNFLHVWEIINLYHKLYVAIESFDDFYREVKHQQNLLPAPVLDPSYLKSLLPRDEYSNNKVLDKFISHVSPFVSPKHFLGNVPVPSSPSHSASQPVEGTWISPINVDASSAPSHSASQPPVAHNPPAQNPTASDPQHIPGSLRIRKSKEGIHNNVASVPSLSASQPPVAHNPLAQNPTASDPQHIPGSLRIRKSKEGIRNNVALAPSHSASQPPAVRNPPTQNNPPAQNPTASDPQHIPGSLRIRKSKERIRNNVALAPSHSASQPPAIHNPPTQIPTVLDPLHTPGSSPVKEGMHNQRAITPGSSLQSGNHLDEQNCKETPYKWSLEERLMEDYDIRGTADGTDGTARSSRQRARLVCFRCGKYGHIERYCPVALSDSPNPNEEDADVKKQPLQDFDRKPPSGQGGWFDRINFGFWRPTPPN
jgi:hypothetical protein